MRTCGLLPAILLSLALSLAGGACGDSAAPSNDAGVDAGQDGSAGDKNGDGNAGDPPPADGGPADGAATDAADAATDAAGATVMGTLTLPGTASGKAFGVRVMTSPGAGAPVAETTGVTTGATTLGYSIAGVPAGTYYLLAFVDVDGSGGTSSTPGDYAGWYGHTGDGNPPGSATAVVPASGSVTFDWSLVLR